MGEMRRLLQGARIDPKPVTSSTSLTELVDNALLAYNGARLREACQLFTQHVLEDDVTVANRKPRKPKRLYEKRKELLELLVREYRAAHR